MKYIVTGGAGFIGSHICETLVSNGHKVIIIDDLSSGRIENITGIITHPNVAFYKETILNPQVLKDLCNGVDGIFHQAALVSVTKSIDDPVTSHAVTLTGALHVLLAARNTGVKRVVSASSASVYGNMPGLPKQEDMATDPQSPYAVEKHCLEEYSNVFSSLYGLQTICLRYFNVYGPRQDPHSDYAAAIPKFIQRIQTCQSLVIYGDGMQTRDFVYVKDVVQANIRAMSSGNVSGVYNIASGVETSVNDLVVTLLRVIGRKMNIEYAEARPGEVKHSVADISKAYRDFNFKPTYTLEEGLREMTGGIYSE